MTLLSSCVSLRRQQHTCVCTGLYTHVHIRVTFWVPLTADPTCKDRDVRKHGASSVGHNRSIHSTCTASATTTDSSPTCVHPVSLSPHLSQALHRLPYTSAPDMPCCNLNGTSARVLYGTTASNLLMLRPAITYHMPCKQQPAPATFSMSVGVAPMLQHLHHEHPALLLCGPHVWPNRTSVGEVHRPSIGHSCHPTSSATLRRKASGTHHLQFRTPHLLYSTSEPTKWQQKVMLCLSNGPLRTRIIVNICQHLQIR